MGTEEGPGRLLRVPEEVAAAIEARLQGTGFANLEEFVTFVLSRLAESHGEVPFSEEEEARLKERLRSLGYID
ncbi:MAG: CopG family transcriptional regulator [Thermoplasmata archaeon]|nr:CopG family transcriptional regulator [Thermoplasmata archaeon]MCI4363237.1 CopG family transcriptional regulator [Thermoplasmata archaeon]